MLQVTHSSTNPRLVNATIPSANPHPPPTRTPVLQGKTAKALEIKTSKATQTYSGRLLKEDVDQATKLLQEHQPYPLIKRLHDTNAGISIAQVLQMSTAARKQLQEYLNSFQVTQRTPVANIANARNSAWYMPVNIYGHEVAAMIDTGSICSLIS